MEQSYSPPVGQGRCKDEEQSYSPPSRPRTLKRRRTTLQSAQSEKDTVKTQNNPATPQIGQAWRNDIQEQCEGGEQLSNPNNRTRQMPSRRDIEAHFFWGKF